MKQKSKAPKPQPQNFKLGRGLVGGRGLPGAEVQVSCADGVQLISMGAIAGAHGIRGGLRVKSFCENPTDIAAYGPLFLLDGTQLTPQNIQAGPKGMLLLTVKEITDRTAAEQLAHTPLYVPKQAIPLEEGETLYADIIGRPVQFEGKKIGTVVDIFSNGAQDVLDIQTPEQNILIPLVTEFVTLQDDHVLLIPAAEDFISL